MTQSLSLDFLCAKTEETEVCLDPLPKTFENLCFVKSSRSLEIQRVKETAYHCCERPVILAPAQAAIKNPRK